MFSNSTSLYGASCVTANVNSLIVEAMCSAGETGESVISLGLGMGENTDSTPSSDAKIQEDENLRDEPQQDEEGGSPDDQVNFIYANEGSDSTNKQVCPSILEDLKPKQRHLFSLLCEMVAQSDQEFLPANYEIAAASVKKMSIYPTQRDIEAVRSAWERLQPADRSVYIEKISAAAKSRVVIECGDIKVTLSNTDGVNSKDIREALQALLSGERP